MIIINHGHKFLSHAKTGSAKPKSGEEVQFASAVPT